MTEESLILSYLYEYYKLKAHDNYEPRLKEHLENIFDWIMEQANEWETNKPENIEQQIKNLKELANDRTNKTP